MFKIDMNALREAATTTRLMANPASLANRANGSASQLAELATLAISHRTVVAANDPKAEAAVRNLIAAAMRACDHWNDSDEAREQMRRECLETPPHLRADLLDHLQRHYPEA